MNWYQSHKNHLKPLITAIVVLAIIVGVIGTAEFVIQKNEDEKQAKLARKQDVLVDGKLYEGVTHLQWENNDTIKFKDSAGGWTYTRFTVLKVTLTKETEK